MKRDKLKYWFIVLCQLISLTQVHAITAKFSVSKSSECAPAVLVFTNNSTQGSGIQYTWNFGLGAEVTTTDPSARECVYSNPGTFQITLKVTDGTSTATTSISVTIYKGPSAAFNADKLYGCPPLTVTFTSNSTTGGSQISDISWDFRNGDYKEGSSVQYTYTSAGTFSLVLKVTDKNGCASTLTSENLISVADKPAVNFAASDTFACAPPLNVTFNNLTTGSSALTFKWDFGNGKTSEDLSGSSVYSSTGNYSVKLKASDQYGCTDSLEKKAYINIGYSKAAISVFDAKGNLSDKEYLCDGIYRFVSSVPDLPDYIWAITDNDKTTRIAGTDTLIYTVAGSGKLTVKLIYGDKVNCTDSTTVIYSKSYIDAAFTADINSFCSLPSQINIVNSSQNADSFSWYLSDKLISSQNISSYTITHADLPTETYKQLYSHDITNVTLPLKLVASNGGACYDSVTKDITISKPVARFVPDKISGCIPLVVTFSDSSKAVSGIDTYMFRTSDSLLISSDTRTTRYTFTRAGVYKVMEVIKSGTCTDTSQIVTISVGDKLTAGFSVTPDEVCNGGSISLKGDAGISSLVQKWHFYSYGLLDLNFNSLPDTTINISADTVGYKTISLQVDYNGCLSETTQKNVLKVKGSVGNFTQSFTCDSSYVYYFKSAVTPYTSLSWNINSAVYSNTDSVRYVFPSSGDYSATLTAVDNSSGCSLTRTKTIKVRSVKASFTLSDTITCVGEKVHLDASASQDYIKTCYNEGFLWYFGDGSAPRRTYLTSWDHTYTSKGTDTISLVVKADNGCTDSLSKVVSIFRPSGSFTSDKQSGCLPSLTVNFVNTSTDTSIISWVWNFGDGKSDSTKTISVSHTYESKIQQTYYPALTVYDSHQCSSSYSIPTQLISINGDFQANDNSVCLGQKITFTPVDSSLTNLYWTFGDGSSSVSTNQHTYLKSGNFSVSLVATKDGCRDTLLKKDYVSVEEANANFTVSDSVLTCYPQSVMFLHDNTIGSPAVSREWVFDSYEMSNLTSDSVQYTFIKPGTFPVSLTVKTLNGCKAEKTGKISVTGPTARVTFSPQHICYNESVSFKVDSLVNVDQWKLLFGDGSSSTENPVSHIYTSRGKIIPTIQLIHGTCNALYVLDTLYVSDVKADFNSSDSSLTVCIGNKLNLINSSLNSDTWVWDINSVQSSTDFNYNNISLTTEGEYSIRLKAMDSYGCSDSITKIFIVAEKPSFAISGDSILCSGNNSITLSVVKEIGSTISWTPATGLSSSSAFVTTAAPEVTTTYTATVTNAAGCSSQSEKTILVNQPFDLIRYPAGDTTIYLGQKAQLMIQTSAESIKYSWEPETRISCTHCNNPWVSPVSTTTYTARVTNDCFDLTEKFNVNVIADFYLEAPSAFTPNGDGNNDIFSFESKNITYFNLKIFNRWGELVFSTTDVNAGWDGSFIGHLQNVDTYKYMLEATSIHGYSFEKRGEFLLLK
jgi:gliding motility-associated-like protein